MTDRKIIFFDIDGTIVTEDTHVMPPNTMKAIKAARENGHLVFINTGRTYINIENSIKEVGFDGYVCGCGTYIIVDEQVLLSKSIEEKIGRKIINKLRECKIDAILEGLEDVYFDSSDSISEEFLITKRRLEKLGLGIRRNWDSAALIYDKLFTVSNEKSNQNEFIKFIETDFDYIDRGSNRAEIVPKGYSKATGIEFLLNYYNISLENSYAIGDSSNDLTMLEYVQNGIAMGKSDECVYEVASFITKDINDDGIGHALMHFGIIPEYS